MSECEMKVCAVNATVFGLFLYMCVCAFMPYRSIVTQIV